MARRSYNTTRKQREVVCGVYKLTHTISKKFYIGSSTDIKQRFSIHKSLWKHGKNHAKLQELYDTTQQILDWQLQVLAICEEDKLQVTEEQFITQHFSNPLCMNIIQDGRSGKRGTTTKTKACHRIAMSLLGKNTSDPTVQRPTNLVFISPAGDRYENIISVKQFAKEHNVLQSSMNGLANGMLESVLGWIREDGPLPRIGDVYDIWPTERLRKHYPEYTIYGPDNSIHKVFSIRHFEQQYNCKVAKVAWPYGVAAGVKGVNNLGHGWRLDTIPTDTIHWEGQVYTNIVSPSQFCKTFNIRFSRFRDYLDGKVKNARKYHIEIVHS